MGKEAAPAAAVYSAFPIRLKPGDERARYLYVRKHKCEPGGDVDLADRTLFVAAVPASFSEERLESLFGRYGDIERVNLLWLSTLPTPGAHILFKSAKAVKRVLEASKPGSPPAEPPPADASSLSGLAKYIQAHRDARPGLDDLQKQVDSWVADFDEQQERQKRAREAAAADDDGWTVVAARKRGKTQDSAGTTSVAGVAPAVAERGRYKGLKTSNDFYRFQRREKQRNAVLELREKFQEDKQRIAELKAARKFKPT